MRNKQNASQTGRLYSESILHLLILLTPLFVNLWVEQQFEASKIWLMRSLIWLLAFAWLYRYFQPGSANKIRPLPPLLFRLIVMLALVLTLATLFSDYRYIALFGTLERANGLMTQLSYLLFFVCVATQISEDQVHRAVRVAVITAVPICLLGLGQAAGYQPFQLLTDGRSAIVTTLGRANFTGAYLALLLPLTFWFAESATNRRSQYGYAILALLQVAVVVLTQARAAWITAAVGISLYQWLKIAPAWPPFYRRLTTLVGASVLGGGLIVVLQRSFINGGSIAARWTIWQASLKLLWPRLWLGYGADTLEFYFPAVYPPQLVYYQGRGVSVDRAHNWLLDWSLNYGIVATGLLIALIVIVINRAWRQITTQQPHAGWTAACTASIGAYLVGNLFLFDVAATALLFWLLLAALCVATNDREESVDHGWLDLLAPYKRVLLTSAFVVTAAGIWFFNFQPLVADFYAAQGTVAIGQGDLLSAEKRYMQAADTQPKRGGYWVAAGLTSAQLGQFDLAEQQLLTAIDQRPTDPAVYSHLATVYGPQALNSADQYLINQTMRTYEKAIELAPTIGLTHQQYADFALRSGDAQLARQQAGRAVDLDATDGVAFGILGWSLLQADQLQAAEEAFTEAVKWEPSSADFFLGLATAHTLQDEIPQAKHALKQSLILNPNYEPSISLDLQLKNR